MIRRYNGDLANNLGNLVSRVATLVAKKCDGIGPAPGDGGELADVAAIAVRRAADAWRVVAPDQALQATWSLLDAANGYLERQQPWKQPQGPLVDRILGDALEALRIVATLASPALPETAQSIWARIGLGGHIQAQRLPGALEWGGYPGGLPVAVHAPSLPAAFLTGSRPLDAVQRRLSPRFRA